MKICILDKKSFGIESIASAFQSLGHSVVIHKITLDDDRFSKSFEIFFEENINNFYDVVFTFNFFPVISNACKKYNVKYVSWVYDSPHVNLFSCSIINPCNYVFIFDHEQYAELANAGIQTVYYLPLAADVKDPVFCEQYACDVSFVGSLYNEPKHQMYDRHLSKISEYTRGYLEGIMAAQLNLHGVFILQNLLENNPAIVEDMQRSIEIKPNPDGVETPEYVYANYFLARKVATIQRMEYIGVVSQKFDMKVYTPGDLSEIPTAKNMGTVDYMTDMNKVFRLSKINLNITLPSIHTGIPLRAMDIMGAGGFLLTNYQTDFFGLFEPDVDYVYYTSLLDAVNKIEYYLEHEDERKAIAEHGKKTMEQFFTYQNQLKQIFEIVEEKSDV